MRIIMIHGISNDRPKSWADDWEKAIEAIIPGQVDEYHPIYWEEIHSRRYDPAQSARQNYLQDLGALTNQAVMGHLVDELSKFLNCEHQGRQFIIAHSLGSALAYQALDRIQIREPNVFFHRFITVGSPLWIPFSWTVKRLALLNIVMAPPGKLVNLREWCNIQGRCDVVAGFGLVPVKPASVNWKCWSGGWKLWKSHSFESYAKTHAFREALTKPRIRRRKR